MIKWLWVIAWEVMERGRDNAGEAIENWDLKL